jgi:hypothetical protein
MEQSGPLIALSWVALILGRILRLHGHQDKDLAVRVGSALLCFCLTLSGPNRGELGPVWSNAAYSGPRSSGNDARVTTLTNPYSHYCSGRALLGGVYSGPSAWALSFSGTGARCANWTVAPLVVGHGSHPLIALSWVAIGVRQFLLSHGHPEVALVVRNGIALL